MDQLDRKHTCFDCDIMVNGSNCSLTKLMEFSKTNDAFVKNLSKSFRYLLNSNIQKLVLNETKFCDQNPGSIQLFKVKLSNDFTQINTQLLGILFSFVKKNYSELRSASIPNNIYHRCGYGEDFSKLRYSISNCLHFLKRLLLATYCNNNEDNSIDDYHLCSFIVSEMKNLILFIGRISQFEAHFVRLTQFRDEKELHTSFYNYFHASLEIWWAFIEISFILRLEKRFNFSEIYLLKEDNFCDLFTQTLRIFLYDVFFLSLSHFNQSSIKDCLYISPFCCSCLFQIVVMIRMLICDSTHTQPEEPIQLDQFYQFLFEALAHFETKPDGSEEKLQQESLDLNHFKTIAFEGHCVKNYNEFMIWIFSSLVPLLSVNFDSNRKLCFSTRITVTIPATVIKMYRLILKEIDSNLNSKNVLADQRVSSLLIFTLKYSQFLSTPAFDLLSLFVEYFLKRLNVNYRIHSMHSLDAYQFVPKNSDKWKEQVEEITTSKLNLFHYDNSFKLFLTFLSVQLRALFKQNMQKFVGLNFQKFISKVLVSLQPRLLKSLEMLGICNLCSFYLVLIDSIPATSWCEIVDKVSNIFKEILKERKPPTMEVWIKFQFTILHLQDSTANLKVVQVLAKNFEQFATDLQSTMEARQIVSVVLLYFAELSLLLEKCRRDAWESINLLLYFKHLVLNLDLIRLASNLHTLAVDPFEMESVFDFLHQLCQSINGLLQTSVPQTSNDDLDIEVQQSDFKDQLIAFSNQMIDSLKEFVRIELSHQNAWRISTLAFDLTSTSVILRHSSICNAKLVNMISFFLTSSERNSLAQLNYLYLLLENQQLIGQLRQESELTNQLISAWCRLLVASDNAHQLGSISRNLTEMYRDQNRSSSAPSVNEDDDDCTVHFKTFLFCLNEQFSRIQDFRDRCVHLAKVAGYFRPMIHECHSILTKPKSMDFGSISRVLQFTSHLVYICSKQIYVVGKSDSILAYSIENILIPPANSSFLKSDQCNLLFVKCFPLIFEGLCQFNSEGDPYIERKMKQLIVFYLPYLTKCCTYQQIKIKFVNRDIYKFWKIHLFSVIERSYLSSRDMLSKHLFDYLHLYCDHDVSNENLLKLSSAILRLSPAEFSFKEYRTLLFQAILHRSIASLSPDETKEFVPKYFSTFIRSNIQNKPAKLFEVLKFLLPNNVHHRYAELFHQLCSEIAHRLDDIERRSLAGNHTILRKMFKDFVAHYERHASN